MGGMAARVLFRRSSRCLPCCIMETEGLAGPVGPEG